MPYSDKCIKLGARLEDYAFQLFSDFMSTHYNEHSSEFYEL
jgi:hypothetical protein